MATDGIKITALTAIAGADVASTDVVPLVDVSDTTQAATGTTKKTTIAGLATAVTAAGSLATDAEVATAVSNHAAATDPHSDRSYALGLVDDLSGVSNPSTARTNLGLGALATQSTITASQVSDFTQASAATLGFPVALRNWRTALARVRANAGDANIVMLGDSTTAGSGASSVLTSAPARLVTQMQSIGIAAAYCSTAGMPIGGGSDSRVTLGTGWSVDIGATHAGIAGGRGYKASSGAAGSFSFTPTESFDSFIIRSVDTSGLGTVTVNVDGGSAITPTVATAGGYTRSTYTCTEGTHTINVTGPTGGVFYLREISVSSSATSRVRVHNLGYGGAKVADFLTTPTFSDTTLLRAIRPDLFIINLIINDSNAASNVATYTANLTTLAATVTGFSIYHSSILMMIGAGSSPEPANYQDYIDAVYSLGYPVVDLNQRWGTYADAQAGNTEMMTDSLHPSDVGYWEQSAAIFNALRLV